MYSYDPRQDIPSPPNNSLPFIPAPDYSKTIKQHHPTANQRPSLLQRSPNSTTNGSNLTIFTDFNQHDHIVDLTNGKMIQAEDLMSKPAKPAHFKLSPEEKREQTKNRVLKMLQTQGVPVFPGLTQPHMKSRPIQHQPQQQYFQQQQQPLNASTPTSQPPPPLSNSHFHQAQPAVTTDPNANVGITKAYIKHLENHRKFDTLHSFQSCENCPICKQMISEIDIIVKQKSRTNNGRPTIGTSNHSHQSLITSGKAFEPLSILEEDEPDEFADDVNNGINGVNGVNGVAPQGYTYFGNNGNYPSTSKNGSLESRRRYNNCHNREASVGSEPNDDVMTARAREDWHASHPNELSIKYGETLRVLKMGESHTCVSNALNQKGWVPNKSIYHMPSGSF
jgi:hypothetical protein